MDDRVVDLKSPINFVAKTDSCQWPMVYYNDACCVLGIQGKKI